VDIESVRWNERWKAFASFGDSAALGLFGGSIAKAFSDSGPDKWTYGGVIFGVVLLWVAWHIRGLIEPEE
jgi:hypothetical protein